MSDGRPYDPDELRRMTEAIGQARAGEGFEFDVINRERDALAALKREQSERDSELTNSRVEQVHAALAEFLRRMNGAGNPGTTEEFKTGFMKKIRGWSISYTAGDDGGPRRFHLTTDGRTDFGVSGELVSYRGWRPEISDRQFDAFMKSLAGILRAQQLS